MNMKVERELLEDRLRSVINDNATNKDMHDKIVELLADKNIPPGETRGILTQSPLYMLETMDINLLYTITKIFYELTGLRVLDPTEYFYDSEIKIGDKWKRESDKYFMDDLLFSSFVQVNDDQWVGVLSSQTIGKLYNSNRILYRPETQRGMRAIKSRDAIIYRVDYNVDAINAIADLLLEGSFISNILTFNVLKNGDDNIRYDGDSFEIFIGRDSEINVADGFHRSYGLLKALAIRPDLDYNWEIRLCNWDVEKAQRFIYQEDNRTPLRREYKESLNKQKFENIIVNNLNERPQNELQFKIATDVNAVKAGDAYVMFNTLAETINDVFMIKSQRDANKTTDFLIEFFNELIGIYIDDFTDTKKSQKTSCVTYSNMFIGYVALASRLYGQPSWQTMLEAALEKVDFSTHNPFWNNINIQWAELRVAHKKQLMNYFRNLI